MLLGNCFFKKILSVILIFNFVFYGQIFAHADELNGNTNGIQSQSDCLLQTVSPGAGFKLMNESLKKDFMNKILGRHPCSDQKVFSHDEIAQMVAGLGRPEGPEDPDEIRARMGNMPHLKICSDRSFDRERYIQGCWKLDYYYKQPNTLVTLKLKKEYFRMMFTRELSLLQRYIPPDKNNPNFKPEWEKHEERWKKFKEKWVKRLAYNRELLKFDRSDDQPLAHQSILPSSQAQPGILALLGLKVVKRDKDTTTVYIPPEKNSLQRMVQNADHVKKLVENTSKFYAEKRGLDRPLTYDLLKTSILLKTTQSKKTKAWLEKVSGGKEPLEKIFGENLRKQNDVLYKGYPELEPERGSNYKLLKKIDGFLKPNINIDQLAEDLYIDQNGQERSLFKQINYLNQKFKVSFLNKKTPEMEAKFDAIDRIFSQATDHILSDLDQDYDDYMNHPEKLYNDEFLLARSIQTSDPETQNLIVQTLATHFCKFKDIEAINKNFRERAKFYGQGVQMVMMAGMLISMGTGVLIGMTGTVVRKVGWNWGAKKLTQAAAANQFVSAATGSIGMAYGIPVSIVEYSAARSEFEETKRKYYLGLTTQQKFHEAREVLDQAEMWAAWIVISNPISFSGLVGAMRGWNPKLQKDILHLDILVSSGIAAQNLADENYLGLGMQAIFFLTIRGQVKQIQRAKEVRDEIRKRKLARMNPGSYKYHAPSDPTYQVVPESHIFKTRIDPFFYRAKPDATYVPGGRDRPVQIPQKVFRIENNGSSSGNGKNGKVHPVDRNGKMHPHSTQNPKQNTKSDNRSLTDLIDDVKKNSGN